MPIVKTGEIHRKNAKIAKLTSHIDASARSIAKQSSLSREPLMASDSGYEQPGALGELAIDFEQQR